MNIEWIHERFVKERRTLVLNRILSGLFPDSNESVLDIGCGDGSIAERLMATKPGLSVTGIDPLVRYGTKIPVNEFNGQKIPYGDRSFDYCLLVDVLHHTNDPMILLFEAARVSRKGVVIKDHYLQGFLGHSTLKFMDDAHNRRYGVSLPYNYWTPEQWSSGFSECGLTVKSLETPLRLYPIWADWLFGRNLHFAAILQRDIGASAQ